MYFRLVYRHMEILYLSQFSLLPLSFLGIHTRLETYKHAAVSVPTSTGRSGVHQMVRERRRGRIGPLRCQIMTAYSSQDPPFRYSHVWFLSL